MKSRRSIRAAGGGSDRFHGRRFYEALRAPLSAFIGGAAVQMYPAAP